MKNFFYFKKQNGFTIIELVIILSLIGILAAVSYPSLNTILSKEDLKSSARKLASSFQKARVQAIENNQPLTFLIDNSSTPGKYICFYDTNSDKILNNSENKQFEISINEKINFGTGNTSIDWNGNTIPSSITFTDNLIIFNSKGLADRSGAVFLENKNKDICFAITVNQIGTVKIREFNGKSW